MIYPDDYVNKILCGDHLVWLKGVPDSVIDLTVTSPPYDKLRDYDGYSFEYQSLLCELYRVTKSGGVVVWVVGDSTIKGSETGTSFRQALFAMECGFRLHDTMIYHKINYVPLTHNRYEQCFEYMFVFSKGKPKSFNPIRVPCKQAGHPEIYGGSDRRINHGKYHAMRHHKTTEIITTKNTKISPNIFGYIVGSEKTGHPAPFPEALARDQILTWSNLDNIVLDPMCGSGTTCKIAKQLGRQFIGIDVSKEYCDIAESRLRDVY